MSASNLFWSHVCIGQSLSVQYVKISMGVDGQDSTVCNVLIMGLLNGGGVISTNLT